MLQNFIASRITEELPFQPTEQQDELIKCLGEYLVSTDKEKLFLLKGYAGTGKTSVIGALVKAMQKLEQKTVLLAPTGRAAKVLTSYAGFSAYTIHKKIYRQKSMAEFKFQLADNLHKHTLFIVDEASMISNSAMESVFGTGQLLSDLIEYVYSGDNCHLLLLGDLAQLPPVMQSISPALLFDSFIPFGLNVHEFTLTHVVRQALKSGILYNATLLRNELEKNATTDFPVFELNNFNDIIRLKGEDLIEEINKAYSEVGEEDTIVITRTNIRSNIYNNGIRTKVLMKEEELSNGDFLMVTKNNYFWNKPYKEIDFIANGDILKISRIRKYYEMYESRFVDLTLESLDYGWEIDARIWLDSLQSASPTETNRLQQSLFTKVAEDYPDIRNKRLLMKNILENEYYNSLQVKFAYAVTCHKAQGGQWKRVFIDQGALREEQINSDYYRWIYTAITRATEKVYLVNFPDDYFR